MYFRNHGLRRACLSKYLISPVSEHGSPVNMLKGPKHCWNLHSTTFIMFSQHDEDGKRVGKCFCYWNLKSWHCLLTYWLRITSINFVIGRIYRNQFKCSYLRNKKIFSEFFALFLKFNQILNILKKTMTLTADLHPRLRTAKDVVR